MALTWVKIGNLKGPKGDVGTWYQRKLLATDNLATVAPGTYSVDSGPIATALGLPPRQGTLETRPFGAGGRTQTFTTNDAGPEDLMEIYERSSNGAGVFIHPEWKRTYPTGETRKAAVPLNFSRGIDTDNRPLVQVRIPVKFGADVPKLRAAFRNYDYKSEVAYPGVLNFAGVAFGKHQINADGSMTGLFSETPTILSSGFSTPDAATTATTGAFTTVNAKAGEEYLLSYAYEATTPGQINAYQLGVCFTSLILSAWSKVGATTASRQNYSPLNVYLEVEVDKETPVYAYAGDSLTAALNASAPRRDSWANKHALAHGAIAQIYAHPGSSLNDWQDPMKPALRAWQHLNKPDRLYMALGFNDITSGRPFTGVQDLFNVAATNLMEKTSKNVYLTTILPNGSTTSQNTVRDAVNNWFKTALPANSQMCYDFYEAIVDPATNLTDAKWSASAGDSHLTTAGYARLAVEAR